MAISLAVAPSVTIMQTNYANKYLWFTLLYAINAETIVRSFEICQASHVTENWAYLRAKNKAVMELILSVFLVSTTRNIHYKFEVDNLFNFDTGVI